MWDDLVTVVEPFEGSYGFEAIDLSNADIDELCAQCEIDHTIPPVPHTRGGSAAGYARWEQFKRQGLKNYARLRNDAALIHQSPVRWAARNNSKPRRPAAECWVFHANTEWSQATYNGKDDETAARSLLVSFLENIGRTFIEPIYQSTRYWRFATAVNPLNAGCLWDA